MDVMQRGAGQGHGQVVGVVVEVVEKASGGWWGQRLLGRGWHLSVSGNILNCIAVNR